MLAARHRLRLSQRGFATKKLLIAAGIAFAIVAVLGLGATYLLKSLPAPSSGGPVTLTYWGLWESPAMMQPLLDKYHEQHPNVTIKYEQRPIENHFASVKSRIADGSVAVPDIVRVHDSWLPAFQKHLAPLPSSVMNASEYESTFYRVNRDMLFYDNNYYGMPLEVDGLALVYNQNLFNKAGITSPPATWDDLRQVAAKITQRNADGDLVVAGVAMGTANNVDHYADIVALLMAQNGVVFTNRDGEVRFHESIAPDGRNLGAEALAFYTMFTTTEKDWDASMEQSTKAFAEGKVGMILIPSWRLLSLVSQNPDLPIRVAPVPHLTTEQKMGYASYWVEVVPEQSANKLEAWKFLAWLTEAEQQKMLVDNQKLSRPFGEPFSRIDLASSLSSDAFLSAYIAQAPDLKASIFAGGTGGNDYNDEINAALAEAIQRSSRSGSRANQAAASALETLAESVTATLEKY